MNEILTDKIAKLTIDLYNSLPKTGKPNLNEWTILAAIVEENHLEQLNIVSLGTGSKCIGENKLCSKGTILNDSHAEVICRRAFLKYLYEQIAFTKKGDDTTIFSADLSGKCFLKEGIRFHMFCSQTPCGDASIFSKRDNVTENCLTITNSDTKLKTECNKRLCLEEDIYRTGAKCLKTELKQDVHGSGVNYHTMGAIRTKPGRGNPTLSVSCSDKFARWIRVGIQGALLSLLLKNPIYLTSIILAKNANYSKEAFHRALVSRFSDVQLQAPYVISLPEVIQSNVTFFQQHEFNPCPSSLIWSNVRMGPKLEISVNGKKQGVTKKDINSNKGHLSICKNQLFKRCLEILKDNKKADVEKFNFITYAELKKTCTDYNSAWSIVKNGIFKLWTNKNEEMLQFTI